MSSTEMRSPIKRKPLRFPGQSVQEEIERQVWEGVAPYFFVALTFALLAALEWWATLRHAPRQPWTYTVIAAAATLFLGWRVLRARSQLQRLRLGRDGEREVGQFLDDLRARGARIFHDLPAAGFNIDHVVLSNHGFYAIETKTRSKPARRDARVTLTEDGVLVNGWRPDRNPVVQARAAARWLEDRLEEGTGERFAVRGVVLFPGWWVEPMNEVWKRSPKMPWVLAPKAFPHFIENEPTRVSESDVRRAAEYLDRYIRSMPTG